MTDNQWVLDEGIVPMNVPGSVLTFQLLPVPGRLTIRFKDPEETMTLQVIAFATVVPANAGNTVNIEPVVLYDGYVMPLSGLRVEFNNEFFKYDIELAPVPAHWGAATKNRVTRL